MTTTSDETYEIEVFFDGGCPLCRREANMLRRRDRRGRIRFTDIDAPEFSAAAIGKTQEELMARMHARLRSGEWLQGVEVFRRLYTLIGFGPIVLLSRLPLVAHLLDLGYAIFARNRGRITGRCTDATCAVESEKPGASVPKTTVSKQEESDAAVS